ncbi:hypothetical protein RF55_26274, partial [Lasius niger]
MVGVMAGADLEWTADGPASAEPRQAALRRHVKRDEKSQFPGQDDVKEKKTID